MRNETEQHIQTVTTQQTQTTTEALSRAREDFKRRLDEALAKNDAEWQKRMDTERADALAHLKDAQHGKGVAAQLTEENNQLKDDLHNVCVRPESLLRALIRFVHSSFDRK